MTKFRTDVTKGGYKILNIIGPDIEGCYGGVVESPDGDFLGCTWGRYGIEQNKEKAYYLIPLDEPKPDHKNEAWLEVLERRLQTLEACSDETMSILQKELKIVKSRLEALEHDNKKSNTWGVRVNGDLQELHNRILRLERKTADTSDYHNLRLQIQDVEKQLEALEQRTQPSDVGADARNYPHEKGVWVTISTLRNVVRTTDLVQGDIGLKALIKRLGLEE